MILGSFCLGFFCCCLFFFFLVCVYSHVCKGPKLTLGVFLDHSQFYSLRLSLCPSVHQSWLVQLNIAFWIWDYRWATLSSGSPNSSLHICTVRMFLKTFRFLKIINDNCTPYLKTNQVKSPSLKEEMKPPWCSAFLWPRSMQWKLRLLSTHTQGSSWASRAVQGWGTFSTWGWDSSALQFGVAARGQAKEQAWIKSQTCAVYLMGY